MHTKALFFGFWLVSLCFAVAGSFNETKPVLLLGSSKMFTIRAEADIGGVNIPVNIELTGLKLPILPSNIYRQLEKEYDKTVKRFTVTRPNVVMVFNTLEKGRITNLTAIVYTIEYDVDSAMISNNGVLDLEVAAYQKSLTLQEHLLRRGLAIYNTENCVLDDALSQRFKDVQRKAFELRIGLWSYLNDDMSFDNYQMVSDPVILQGDSVDQK